MMFTLAVNLVSLWIIRKRYKIEAQPSAQEGKRPFPALFQSCCVCWDIIYLAITAKANFRTILNFAFLLPVGSAWHRTGGWLCEFYLSAPRCVYFINDS